MNQVIHHGYAITVTANNDRGLWRAHAIITWDKGKFELDDEGGSKPDESRKTRRRIGKTLGNNHLQKMWGRPNTSVSGTTAEASHELPITLVSRSAIRRSK